MTLTKNFNEGANQYGGYLTPAIGASMQEMGFTFLQHRSSNDGPLIPNPSWEFIMEALGGENAINADFDREKDPAFTITHIESETTVTGNSAVSTLADLWIELNKVTA